MRRSRSASEQSFHENIGNTGIRDNFPRSLAFYVPDGIAPGAYDMEVRTRWSRSGRVKKEMCCASAEIVVTEERLLVE